MARRTDVGGKGSFATALRSAEAHRAAGRLTAAEAQARRVLDIHPDHPAALHVLGLTLLDAGQPETAHDVIRRAEAADPSAVHAIALGRASAALARTDEAIAWFTRALERDPAIPEAHFHLGQALLASGRVPDATNAFSNAIRLRPRWAEPYIHLSAACRAGDDPFSAEEAARHAVSLAPKRPEALAALAHGLVDTGQNDKAVDAWRATIAVAPRRADYLNELRKSLSKQERLGEAATIARRLVALEPGNPLWHYELSGALAMTGEVVEAEQAARVCVGLAPAVAIARCVLGNALQMLGRLDEALLEQRHALALDPDLVEARYSEGTILLAMGRLTEGWDGYELRWRRFVAERPRFPAPPWDGRAFPGQTLFVHDEQGLGDMIQVARYLPMVAARGGSVVVETRPALRRLFSHIQGVTWREKNPVAPPHHLHCPMMSLPRAFGTTLETIPSAPYLVADADETAAWQDRLKPLPGLRVGLFWSGGATYLHDRIRSLPAKYLPGLSAVPGISWVSLQPGGAPPSFIQDWTSELTDVAATAALISALDLVVSVDTMVVHLAGALGRPVWLMNKFITDWRWMLGRPDSPWYPTLRIFRQPAPGDWQSVLRDVMEALTRYRAERDRRPEIPG